MVAKRVVWEIKRQPSPSQWRTAQGKPLPVLIFKEDSNQMLSVFLDDCFIS